MPYMQRITWSGIALHAGVLPGYPASHGCIRLTNDFATRLWHLTKRGTRVIIAPSDIQPVEISNERFFAPKPKLASGSSEPGNATLPGSNAIAVAAAPAPIVADAKAQETAKPAPGEASPQKVAPITIFVSRKLSKLFVRQGFSPVFDSPVEIQNQTGPMGTHVFTAMGLENGGAAMRWTVVSLPERTTGQKTPAKSSQKEHVKHIAKTILPTPDKANAAFNRIEIPKDAAERIAELLTPGSTLIVSDYGISDETGQDTDFIVLTR